MTDRPHPALTAGEFVTASTTGTWSTAAPSVVGGYLDEVRHRDARGAG